MFLKFEHKVCDSFSHFPIVGITEIVSVVREISLACSSHFAAYTHTFFSKTAMPDSLIIVKFEHQVQHTFLHIPTVGICEIISMEREMFLARG